MCISKQVSKKIYTRPAPNRNVTERRGLKNQTDESWATV